MNKLNPKYVEKIIIRAKINNFEKRKSKEKIDKTKADSLKRVMTLISLQPGHLRKKEI